MNSRGFTLLEVITSIALLGMMLVAIVPSLFTYLDTNTGNETRTGAVAADMESSAVAAASVTFNVPMMVVRAISDGVNDVIPLDVMKAVDEFGRPRYGRLLGTLARRPQDVRSMLALAGGFRAACRTLRAVVRCTGPGFRCPQ